MRPIPITATRVPAAAIGLRKPRIPNTAITIPRIMMAHQFVNPNFLKSKDSMKRVIPSIIIQKANTNGKEAVTAQLLQRKKIPMKICNSDDNILVPLFGRNFCVLNVNIRVKRPERRIRHPNNHALPSNVCTG